MVCELPVHISWNVNRKSELGFLQGLRNVSGVHSEWNVMCIQEAASPSAVNTWTKQYRCADTVSQRVAALLPGTGHMMFACDEQFWDVAIVVHQDSGIVVKDYVSYGASLENFYTWPESMLVVFAYS